MFRATEATLSGIDAGLPSYRIATDNKLSADIDHFYHIALALDKVLPFLLLRNKNCLIFHAILGVTLALIAQTNSSNIFSSNCLSQLAIILA